ncbi:hypothetical protein R3P38DRAFT_2793744 [Favolaschia claudopus]|uniref:Uncharacterized protein n=1 Tax=Favolaschia claudopus TaxID=2862362 RepID=A0AAW0AC80_9AGAR
MWFRIVFPKHWLKVQWTQKPDQFTSIAHDVKREREEAGEPEIKSAFPVFAVVPDSPRYENAAKPSPCANRYCGLSGWPAGFSSAMDGTKVADRFTVGDDTVVHLGSVVSTTNNKGKGKSKVTPLQSTPQASGSAMTLKYFSTSRD